MTRVPGGMLQNAPVVSPAPINPRLPRPGMNAPIMRRGVDGEPADSTPTAPEDKSQ